MKRFHRVPPPYNKYFRVAHYEPQDGEYAPGDTFNGITLLAYLEPKPQYEDIIEEYPMLTDNEVHPVCDLVRERWYPVSIEQLEQEISSTADVSASFDETWHKLTHI